MTEQTRPLPVPLSAADKPLACLHLTEARASAWFHDEHNAHRVLSSA